MPGFLSVRPQDWGTPGLPSASTRLYLRTQNTLYKSTDLGATWTTVSGHGITTLGNISVFGGAGGNDTIYLDGDFPGEMVKSVDGGATWTSIPLPPELTANVLGSAVAGNGTIVVYLNDSGTLVFKYSTNDGSTWNTFDGVNNIQKPITAGATKFWFADHIDGTRVLRYNSNNTGEEIISLGSPGQLAVHGISDSIALVASGPFDNTLNTLRKIIGSTATNITPPGTTLEQNGWWDASTPDGTTIIAHIWDWSTNDGADAGEIWHSTDGGSTWTMVKQSIDLQPGLSNYLWPTTVYDPNNSLNCWVIGGQYQDFFSREVDAKIFKSTDGGATWDNGTVVASGLYRLGGIYACSG